MNVEIKPGKYVVAVSGGVDSVILLDILSKLPKLQLVVAHFDHGIRADSKKDRKFVEKLTQKYGLDFVFAEGKLGPQTSEADARDARYNFLHQVLKEYKARAIITAHHQDDMLETAILNLLRGTGRKGLSSLASHDKLLRPLLEFSKKQIKNYAEEHQLKWQEDSTNADERYLRNYIRRNILSKFGDSGKASLLERIRVAGKVNQEIDQILEEDLEKQPASNELSRAWYLQLPYAVASEIMATWLRRNGIGHFDRTLIDHLVVAAKTAKPGKLADIDVGHILQFTKDKITLKDRNT